MAHAVRRQIVFVLVDMARRLHSRRHRARRFAPAAPIPQEICHVPLRCPDSSSPAAVAACAARLACSPRRPGRRADQDRPGHRAVGPVGAGRRGDHARPQRRDRRDQRQGRPARRPQARAGAPRRRGQPGQGRDRRARADLQGEGRRALRRARHAGVDGDRADRQRRRRCRSWARGPRARAITKNGANPNFVFRVSAVDEIVDKAMLQLRAEDLQGGQAAG